MSTLWFSKIYQEYRRYLALLSNFFSKPYSHLYILSDQAQWVLDEEAKEMCAIARSLGYKAHFLSKLNLNIPQVVHYTSQFSLLSEKIYHEKNRISIDYFHGKPEQGENFRKCFEALREHHEQIRLIRVSHKEMEGVIKTSGIDPLKVRRIPIGINLDLFQPQTKERRSEVRERLNIPQDATLIGSFQKDGVGWNDGGEPKLIKGPDIFIKVLGALKKDVPNLWVLLSGPARGYVKKELETLNIPYRHVYEEDYKKVSSLYDALDLYLITSREEGGPKACVESMAKGIPLITTAVGQCQDLVITGENGMMVAIDSVDELTQSCLRVLNDSVLRTHIVERGLATAQNQSYDSQKKLWGEYLKELTK